MNCLTKTINKAAYSNISGSRLALMSTLLLLCCCSGNVSTSELSLQAVPINEEIALDEGTAIRLKLFSDNRVVLNFINGIEDSFIVRFDPNTKLRAKEMRSSSSDIEASSENPLLFSLNLSLIKASPSTGIIRIDNYGEIEVGTNPSELKMLFEIPKKNLSYFGSESLIVSNGILLQYDNEAQSVRLRKVTRK